MHPDEWENLLWYFVGRGDPSECWEWEGVVDKDGYGSLMVSGEQWRSHRLMYKHVDGDADECVLHHCDNRLCCNPDHLYEGDREDNMRDCIERGNRAYVGPEGEKNVNAKLSEGEVERVVEMVEGGASQVDVADEFEVSFDAVNDIINGHSWTSVTGRG